MVLVQRTLYGAYTTQQPQTNVRTCIAINEGIEFQPAGRLQLIVGRLEVRKVAGDDILELVEVGGTDASDGVPALGRVEAGRAAAGVVARGDVVPGVGRERVGRVHERVEETERGQALGETRRVEQRDDAGDSGRGGGGAADGADAATEEDAEEAALGGDVGDGLAGGGMLVSGGGDGEDGMERTYATVGVVETLVGARGEVLEVLADGELLVERAGELCECSQYTTDTAESINVE